jgi:hypothetical protein
VIIKQYQVFYMSHGEYSDYQVIGVFRAMREIDTNVEWAEFCAEQTDMVWNYFGITRDKFVAWLIEKKIFVELESVEWELPW